MAERSARLAGFSQGSLEEAVERAGSLVVDESELLRFVEWVRPLGEAEAYEVLLLVRSSGMKEKYGFKGSDHKLASRVVHGYLSSTLPAAPPFHRPVEHWRLRLYEDVHRLAAEAVKAPWHYVRYRPGSSSEVDEVLRIPWQLIGVFVTINPSDILRASLDTVKDVETAVWSMASSGSAGRVRDFYRRPDERYHSNIMKHMKTRFHVVDVDDARLAARLRSLLREELGYAPAEISTRRGVHFLVELPLLAELGAAGRWVGPQSRDARVLVQEARQAVRRGGSLPERLRAGLEEYVWGSRDPLWHRLEAASLLYRGPRGEPLVEVKRKSQEPVPGTVYKLTVVRFTPERL